jgi:hypothetical protein
MDRVGFEPTTSEHSILVPSAVDENIHQPTFLLIVGETDSHIVPGKSGIY